MGEQVNIGECINNYTIEPLIRYLHIQTLFIFIEDLCVSHPPGSTDCICFATVGTNDPVTSALHIIVGE